MKQTMNADLQALYNSGVANFSSASKDLVLFRLMRDNESKKSGVYPKYVLRFLHDCGNEVFKKRINDDYHYLTQIKANSKNGYESVLNTAENSTAIPLSDILKKNRGKIIYLDFWASWCAPCKREMKSSFLLQNDLSGRDIVFIYISMDANKNEWITDLKSYSQMNDTNSFILLNEFSSVYARKNRITSIPRYIIIDKKGAFVDTDALRPSDQSLKNQLFRLTENE